MAILLGAAILVVVGAMIPLYPQVTDDESRGGPKKKQPLPSSRAVVMSMSLQIKFHFHSELVICWEGWCFIPVPDYCFLGNASDILLFVSLLPAYL